jgi:hypothetical protein
LKLFLKASRLLVLGAADRTGRDRRGFSTCNRKSAEVDRVLPGHPILVKPEDVWITCGRCEREKIEKLEHREPRLLERGKPGNGMEFDFS